MAEMLLENSDAATVSRTFEGVVAIDTVDLGMVYPDLHNS